MSERRDEMLPLGELAQSDDVGEWTPGLVVLCNPEPDEPCDCGYIGPWEHRWVMVQYRAPKQDIGRRRSRDEWPVMAGYDERCPGCGDIERFDLNANRVAMFSDHAEIVALGGPS